MRSKFQIAVNSRNKQVEGTMKYEKYIETVKYKMQSSEECNLNVISLSQTNLVIKKFLLLNFPIEIPRNLRLLNSLSFLHFSTGQISNKNMRVKNSRYRT